MTRLLRRVRDESSQAWAITVKDIRVYYLTPPMIMFGLLMPFFMFFSFSVKREMTPGASLARLLALITFFTASSAGPVIIPLERRTGTLDRLLAAPLSTTTLLVAKSLVGIIFGIGVAMLPFLASVLIIGVNLQDAPLLIVSMVLSSCAFSALGLLFASYPTQSPGNIMMPSTLLRWPLLFISGIFIPLEEMSSWARALSFLSPLTYAQDLMNHAVLGVGVQAVWFNLAILFLFFGACLYAALRLQYWSRRLGY